MATAAVTNALQSRALAFFLSSDYTAVENTTRLL